MRQQKNKTVGGGHLLPSLLGQSAVLLAVVGLFLQSALYGAGRRDADVPQGIPLLAGLLCAGAVAAAVVWLLCAWRRGGRPLPWLKEAAPAFLLLALALVMRLPQWGNPPGDDAASYYEALYEVCRNFTFSFDYWFHNFRLMSHTTWGFVTLLAIPEFIRPGNYNTVWVAQTAISLVSILCVYDLLRRDTRIGRRGAFWGALVFGCGAMFLGLDSYLQMDFGCAAFFFWMLWAAGTRRYLLMLAAALLTITSKELGIALVAGFYLGCFGYEWRQTAPTDRFGTRLWAVLRRPYLGLLTVVGAVAGVGLAVYLFGSSMSWGGLGQEGGSLLGHYGLDIPYMLFKLFQCVTTNFVWLLLAVAGVLLGRRRSRQTVAEGGGPLPCILCGAAGAAALYYLCSCLVVTFSLPRYNLPLEMILVFVCAAVFAQRTSGWGRRALCGVAAALLLVQSYLTIDPVMKLLYTQVVTDGAVKLSKMTDPVWGSDEENDYLGSHIIYNYQYSTLLRSVRKILAAENYDEDTDVVVLGLDSGLYIGAGGKYGWDPMDKDFTYSYGADTIPILTTQTDPSNGHSVGDWQNAGRLKGKAIFIWAPRPTETDCPEAERGRAIPEFYTNIEAKQMADWPYGRMTYYTADYTG